MATVRETSTKSEQKRTISEGIRAQSQSAWVRQYCNRVVNEQTSLWSSLVQLNYYQSIQYMIMIESTDNSEYQYSVWNWVLTVKTIPRDPLTLRLSHVKTQVTFIIYILSIDYENFFDQNLSLVLELDPILGQNGNSTVPLILNGLCLLTHFCNRHTT